MQDFWNKLNCFLDMVIRGFRVSGWIGDLKRDCGVADENQNVRLGR